VEWIIGSIILLLLDPIQCQQSTHTQTLCVGFYMSTVISLTSLFLQQQTLWSETCSLIKILSVKRTHFLLSGLECQHRIWGYCAKFESFPQVSHLKCGKFLQW